MNTTEESPSTPQNPPRRRWMAWGLSSLGLAASASGAYWLLQRTSNAAPATQNQDPLWGIELPGPNSTPLQLAAYSGKPLLINFWATWCAPCVEELPLLNQFHQKPNGWVTIGIAVDSPANVQRFIERFNLSFPIGIAGTAGIELAKTLGNTGGLPFTLVVDRKGMIRERKIGQITPADLANWELLA